MEQSNLFSINWRDVVNGLVMAVLTPAVFIVQQSLSLGELTFDWKAIGVASLAGAVGYVIKNFFTPKPQ